MPRSARLGPLSLLLVTLGRAEVTCALRPASYLTRAQVSRVTLGYGDRRGVAQLTEPPGGSENPVMSLPLPASALSLRVTDCWRFVTICRITPFLSRMMLIADMMWRHLKSRHAWRTRARSSGSQTSPWHPRTQGCYPVFTFRSSSPSFPLWCVSSSPVWDPVQGRGLLPIAASLHPPSGVSVLHDPDNFEEPREVVSADGPPFICAALVSRCPLQLENHYPKGSS